MSRLHISWATSNDWRAHVQKVLEYFETRPNLKYGPAKDNKALPVLNSLCDWGCGSRQHLNEVHHLTTG